MLVIGGLAPVVQPEVGQWHAGPQPALRRETRMEHLNVLAEIECVIGARATAMA